MQPVSTRVHATTHSATLLRRSQPEDFVGAIVSERGGALASVPPVAMRMDLESRSGFDLCRLLIAVVGLGAYLGLPISLVAYAGWKLLG